VPSFTTHVLPARLMGCCLCAVVLLAGCEKQEEISVYTVPSHESLQTPEFQKAAAERKPKPARMLAAIAPNGPLLWFFKLQGPPEAVANRDAEFREFLASVHFNAAGDPEWTLPKDWSARPGSQMRFATLVLPGDPPLEVTVTKLPAGNDLDQARLDNINRWRGQLDLPHIEIEDLPSRTENIEAGDITVTYLNIVGKAKPAAAMAGGMPPMIQRAISNREGPADDGTARQPAKAAEQSDIKFEKPGEWTEVPPKQFITAAFEVTDGAKKLSITVSRAGGSKVANVNRWRGQLGVGPLSEDEINKSLQKFTVGDRAGQLVEIKSDTQTLTAVMIEDGERTVFVKLMGDPELAVRERKRFETFAKSLKF
jgi:hypothetical protein